MNQSDIKPERLSPAPVLKPVLFSVLILISGIAIGAGLTLIFTSKPKFRSKKLVMGYRQYYLRHAGMYRLSPWVPGAWVQV